MAKKPKYNRDTATFWHAADTDTMHVLTWHYRYNRPLSFTIGPALSGADEARGRRELGLAA